MRIVVSLCLIVACASSLSAENWPNWRGPSYTGVASGKNYPTEWSATSNVAWKIELPGKGASTPIVWGEHIFLTCGIDGKNGLLAFNRQGKELWRATFGSEVAGKNKKATGCNPSCATDGQYVFAYFKNGDLACVDFAGKVVWQKNLQGLYGKDTEKNRHAYSSSPILADGKIYLTREDGKTFVLTQGDEFKVLAGNELDGTQTVATPVFADGRILLRTETNLYCIGG